MMKRSVAKERGSRNLMSSSEHGDADEKKEVVRKVGRIRLLRGLGTIQHCQNVPFYWNRWADSRPGGVRYVVWTSLVAVTVLLVCSSSMADDYYRLSERAPPPSYDYRYYPRSYDLFPRDDPIVPPGRRMVEYGERDDYKRRREAAVTSIVTKYCKEQHAYQLQSFPTCNTVHETTMLHFNNNAASTIVVDRADSNRVRKLGNGHYRDVWEIARRTPDSAIDKVVLKTLRYEHAFDARNEDRHRRDALAMDRLTFSPYVVDIYAYCSNSGLYEHGRGDLDALIWGRTKIPRRDKLRLALQVARGLADTHDADHTGVPSIAHTDIAPKQYVLIDGVYKLNDFNRCRLLARHRWLQGHTCGYKVGKNKGKFRSPEEYRYDEQTEKVDVYSMGNIFYALLTGDTPFSGWKEKAAFKAIMDGKRPTVAEEIRTSTHPVDRALIKAMQMSHIHKPAQRATAGQVADYLSAQYESLKKAGTLD